jgi:UDP-2,3-diacylglucosamine pyrophosphatase LpxH
MLARRRSTAFATALSIAVVLGLPATPVAALSRAPAVARAKLPPRARVPARQRILKPPSRRERFSWRLRVAVSGARPKLDNSAAARQQARELHRAFPDRANVLANQAADEHVQSVVAHSERGGRYLILSDLHWGLGRTSSTSSGWFYGEDFRQDAVFERFVKKAAADPRPTTLVLNGDWIEFIRHVDADASVDQLKRHVRKVLRCHAREVRALTDAVVKSELRILYTRGNHDVQLVDPQVRAALLTEMARIGGLGPQESKRFRRRVAWSGHAAVLGAYGEGLVMHGDIHDAVNNWRSPANPYDGQRRMESNLGWQIVSTLLRPADLVDAAMNEEDKVKAVFRYIRRTVSSRSAFGLLVRAVLPIPRDTGGERLAAVMDDRTAMKAWVRRTGVAERTARAIPGSADGGMGEHDWVLAIERIARRMPEPVLDRLRSNIWGLNVARALGGFAARMLLGPRHDRRLLDQLGELPNVRYVVWGHNHSETALQRKKRDKGTVEHINSGTWTRTPKGWPLNVVVASTDGDGRLQLGGLHRTGQTGELHLITHKVRTPTPRVIGSAPEAIDRMRIRGEQAMRR